MEATAHSDAGGPHLPKSQYAEPGERVVNGQRMMQATSDIFTRLDQRVLKRTGTCYWRQASAT